MLEQASLGYRCSSVHLLLSWSCVWTFFLESVRTIALFFFSMRSKLEEQRAPRLSILIVA